MSDGSGDKAYQRWPLWAAGRAQSVGTLRLELCQAHRLPIGDSKMVTENGKKVDRGSSDPYVIIECAGHKVRSRTLYKTLNPVWDQTFELRGELGEFLDSPLIFHVWDKDTFSKDDALCRVTVDLAEALKSKGRAEIVAGAPGQPKVLDLTNTDCKPELFFNIEWHASGDAGNQFARQDSGKGK